MILLLRTLVFAVFLPFLSPAIAATDVSPVVAMQVAPEALRAQFIDARRRAESGPDGAWLGAAQGLEEYPLYPYLEYFDLRRRIDTVSLERVENFLQRHRDIAVAPNLRHAMQRRLLREKRWNEALQIDRGGGPASLRCGLARAMLETDQHEALEATALELWMVGRSQHEACDPVFSWLRERGLLTEQRWMQRFRLAVIAGELRFANFVAGQLPSRSQGVTERWLEMAQQPRRTLRAALTWSEDDHSAEIIAYGMARMARSDSSVADELWATLKDRFQFTDAQRQQVEGDIALFLAVTFSDAARARIDALDADSVDDVLREWRVRVALDAGDWSDALGALDRLSASQADEARWRYLRARMLSRLNRSTQAIALLEPLSDESHYHGFLAADLLRRPYSICPSQLAPDAGARATVLADSGIQRALELYAISEFNWARREWDQSLSRLEPGQRTQAVLIASEHGWHDRGIWALAAADQLSAYQWRFPIDFEDSLRSAAQRNELELPWVLALIRAESAWAVDARSGADARGLMQVLPGTAAEVAQRNGLVYRGAASLFDPQINIALGSAFLAELGQRFDASPVLIAAAYNAGPSRARRWLERPGPVEPDLWIETLSYRETREYVARLLAFSVIYDWRINGDARRLASRMPRIGQKGAVNGPRTSVECRQAAPG